MNTAEQAVPSACKFWRQAETELFFAPVELHYNCPVGSMVMGFMCGYICAEEPAGIPTVKHAKAGILYGPLSEFRVDSEVVLL